MKKRNSQISLRKSLLAMAITTVLVTGCGGSDKKSEEPSITTSIGGVAAKGIVSDGVVTAYILGSDGVKGAVVGTAVTDSKGEYSLPTDASYDGTSPLLLELTAGATTEMACDSINGCGDIAHGGSISLADNETFKLTSVIPAAGTETDISASITAFTNIAANSIVASGAVSDESILATTSEINQVVGVNILETSPVDAASEAELSAASVDAQRYSIMLAALATQAFDETTSVEEMQANLESFSTDFTEDGDIGDEGGLSLTDLYADANEAAEAAGGLSQETVDEVATLGDSVVGQLDDEGVFDPEPTTAENPSDIAQAKAFVTEVRTWADALQDLESPAETFLDEADTISETLSSNSKDVFEIYAWALDSAAKAIKTSMEDDEAVVASADVLNNDDEVIGSVNITDNSTADSTEYILSATGLGSNDVVLITTLSINESLDTDTLSAGDTTINFDGVVNDSQVRISMTDATFTGGLAEDLLIDDGSDEAEVTNASLSGGLTVETLENNVATGEKIEASAEISLIRLDSDAQQGNTWITLEKIALNNLSVSNDSGETAGLSASLVINNASSFDLDAYIEDELGEEDYLDATLSISGNITLEGKGEAVLSITGNSTGVQAGNLTATLGYDGKSLQLTAETTNGDEDGTDAKLTFSNADGVAMTVEEADDWKSGVVTVGESIVGHIDEDAIIRYNDGTFESL